MTVRSGGVAPNQTLASVLAHRHGHGLAHFFSCEHQVILDLIVGQANIAAERL